MQIFDDLHVVRRYHHREVAQCLHLSALIAHKANIVRSSFPCYLETIQYIKRIPTSAYRKRHITRLDKTSDLLGKNVLVPRIIGPRGHQRYVVGKRQYAETLRAVHCCAFSKIAREMRSQCCA